MSQKRPRTFSEKDDISSPPDRPRSIYAETNRDTNTTVSSIQSEGVPDSAKKISPENVSKRLAQSFSTESTEGKSTGDSSAPTEAQDSLSTKTEVSLTKNESPPTKNAGTENNIERALLEIAPRKAKRMFERRKRARMFGDDDATGLWEKPSATYVRGKSHSLKQIQRLSNELEQVLGVLCNGDKSVAADVLTHLMTKRHMGSNLLQSVEQKISNMSERSIDSRIVDGIVGFFEHHQTRGTRPTEAAQAVDAVMVACCWDIGDTDDRPSAKSSTSDTPTNPDKQKSAQKFEKRISNSALIDRLHVNRTALKRAREKAQSIKIEGNAHYKPKDRKLRKDKGVPAQIYREVRKVEEITGSPREKNEYTAVDALTTMVIDTDKETSLKGHDEPAMRPSSGQPLPKKPSVSHQQAMEHHNANQPHLWMLYGNPPSGTVPSSGVLQSSAQMGRASENPSDIMRQHHASLGGRETYPNPDGNYFRQLNLPQIPPHVMDVNKVTSSRVNLHPMYRPPSDTLGGPTHPGMMNIHGLPHTSMQHQQIMRNQTNFNQPAMLQPHMSMRVSNMGTATQRSTLPHLQIPAIGAPNSFHQQTAQFRSEMNMQQQYMTPIGAPGNYNNIQIPHPNQVNIPPQRQPQPSVSGDPNSRTRQSDPDSTSQQSGQN